MNPMTETCKWINKMVIGLVFIRHLMEKLQINVQNFSNHYVITITVDKKLLEE